MHVERSSNRPPRRDSARSGLAERNRSANHRLRQLSVAGLLSGARRITLIFVEIAPFFLARSTWFDRKALLIKTRVESLGAGVLSVQDSKCSSLNYQFLDDYFFGLELFQKGIHSP